LNLTKEKSLSYIGFSQGTTQAFAALSIHPQLNQKVNMMIALAPATSPPGLHNPIVDGLMKASPTLVFLFFGRKAILSSAVMWQSILYNPIWNWTIDAGLKFLFNWHGKNIEASQKVAAYSHLYSFTSVKAVVHWFQIMRRGESSLHPLSLNSSANSLVPNVR
jgi:lysosomal acid lipase/cholesteryl ester hydrolase